VRADFDASVPNMARVYDALLAGKDNYAADRAEAERLVKICPLLPAMARENRAFLAHVAGWAAGQGTGQFIDLGAGLPVTPPVHQIHQAARQVEPDARVAYVDNDPVVLAHARALLATNDGVTAVEADLRDPAAVLGHPALRAVIDPAQPAAVIFGAVLHFLTADAARAVTAGYTSRMAPGSYLIITCASFDNHELAVQLAGEYTAATFCNHPAEVVESFFDGLELAGPGVTEALTWRAWLTEPVPCDRDGHVLAGVARLPKAHDA
jgi:O-methyltransferase involved in polyketide biosynthesis